MQVVINIPDEYLNSSIIDLTVFTEADHTITYVNVEDECADFKVLPKGHGRLIDEREISKFYQVGLIIEGDKVTRCLATDAPTVIPEEK